MPNLPISSINPQSPLLDTNDAFVPGGAPTSISDRRLRLPEPADEARPWHGVFEWRCAVQPPATHSADFRRLVLRDSARDMRRALIGLGDDLLLPSDAATRDVAVQVLDPTRMADSADAHLTAQECLQLHKALQVGEACMWAGPFGNRSLRSCDELQALRNLTAWAKEENAPQSREELVRAIRAPIFPGGRAVVRWRVEEAGNTLDRPPQASVEALLRRRYPSFILTQSGLDLDVEDGLPTETPAFDDLQMVPVPTTAISPPIRLRSDISNHDMRHLMRVMRQSTATADGGAFGFISALEDALSALPRSPSTDSPPRNETISTDQPPADLAALDRLIREQFNNTGVLSQVELAEHLPRLEHVMRAVADNPALDDDIRAALAREEGTCIDANLARLDEIETLIAAGGALKTLSTGADHCFRMALRMRARQETGRRHHDDPENLERAHGLVWAVDLRLAELLGLRGNVSRPHFELDARLPGSGAQEELNDAQAADRLIATEIAEDFPSLRAIAAGAGTGAEALHRWIDDVAKKDSAFLSEKARIESEFNRQREELADDESAGMDAFLRKEEALNRARVAPLLQALEPTLAKLRAAGIGA